MITDTKHVLQFGALDWKGGQSPVGWRIWALAEGATLGNAVPVERELAHQLMDGSIVERHRHDNRIISLDVLVEADDSIALAEGAAALGRECDAPSTLVFTPPDGLGAPTVFEVVTARADWVFDDRDELRTQRRYRMTLTCMPFGLSPESTTDSAIVVESPEGDQEINDCDATAGFTGLDGATVSLDTSVKREGTGSIKLTPESYGNVVLPWQPYLPGGRFLTAAAAVELTDLSLTDPAKRPYISFYGYAKDTREFSATLRVNDVEAQPISATRADSSWVKYTFHTDVTDTITSLRIDQYIVYSGQINWVYQGGEFVPNPAQGYPAGWVPRLDNIRRDGNWTTKTRQTLRSIPVGGSARTPKASLEISHPTNGLGKVLLLSTPALASGFMPDLMQWCTQSTTSSSGSISGRLKSFVSTPTAFEFPAAMVPPGSYQLIGFMQTGSFDEGGARVEVDMSTKIGSTILSERQHAQRIDVTGNGVFDFVDCGPITLPTSQVPAGSDATIRLEVNVIDHIFWSLGDYIPDGSFQDFYLIPLVDGTALNIFDCGGTGTAAVGTANNRLWLDAATLSSRTPSAWMGTREDRSDAYHAGSKAMRWQPLSLPPPEVLVFTANSGGTHAQVNLTYTRAWQGLAPE